jgi:uncharacterized protein YgiM (DUF1202 family)
MKMSLWLILGVGLSTGLLAQQVTNAPAAGAPAAVAPVAASPADTAAAPAAKPKKKAPSKKAPKKSPQKKAAAAKAPADLKTVPLIPGPATVVASNVNVRGQAKLRSEVITRITKGQQVTVVEELIKNNSGPDEPSAWAKIVLPQGTPVWVSAGFVDPTKRTVVPKRLNLRSGPGENYSIVGRMERGETVKELSTKGAWMEIEAPTNAYAFVAAQYLKQESPAAAAIVSTTPAATTPAPAETAPTITTTPAPAPPAAPSEPAPTTATVTEPPAVAAAPTETPAVAPAPSPAVTNAPPAEMAALTPAPATEGTNALVAAEEQPPKKRIVMREGFVRGTASIQAPTHFSLVSADATRKMINYLYSPSIELDLRRYKGLHVIVTGEESLEERWGNTPVLSIQKIQVLED